MKYSDMIELIKAKYHVDLVEIQQDSDFIDITLLDKEMSFYRDDSLYIGHLAQLNKEINPPVSLLYFADISQNSVKFLFNAEPTCPKSSMDSASIQQGSKPPLNKAPLNSAQIKEGQFAAIFNLIKQELIKSLKAEQAYSKMLKMILDGKGLSAVLCETAKACGNPLVVLDISGKILAHSSPFDIPDPLWIQSIERGYCPYEFMDHIKQIRSKKMSPKNSETFISICSDNQLVYLCSKVISDDRLLGYVFMLRFNSPIDYHSKELLPLISQAAGEMILRNQDNAGLRSYLYQSILADMLAGIDPEHANARIQASELPFPERMKVLIIRPSYYHGHNYLKGELMGKLQRIFDKAPSLNYRKEMVLVIPLDEAYNIDSSSLEQLKSLADGDHLQVGISNAFTQPSFFANYYSQADEAIRFSQLLGSENDIHYYTEYSFYSMLSTIPLEIRLGRFCHPALAKLRSYDHEKGTELYNTLKVLTETGFNMKKTSDILYLHRNTLIYRKQRIAELCGLDFDDSKLLFGLMYSFKIDGFLENQA